VLEELRHFIPSADEVHRLQTATDQEARLAQKVFEQGHYAGRTHPTSTRQGTYATTPSGVLLGSINSNDPRAMARMLRQAREKWNSLSASERMLDFDPAGIQIRRPESFFPSDGLALKVFTRDLPREQTSRRDDWRQNAWNQDFLWYRKEEAAAFVPSGEGKHVVPEPVVRRMARFNFVDIVRGQTFAYADGEISVARLESEVVRRTGDKMLLRFSGETKADKEGRWPIAGFDDANDPKPQRMGMHLRLHGYGTFDQSKGQFESFELVALGTRYGATQYNGRRDDLEPNPIGFYLSRVTDAPADRVAPSMFWGYGWR
jgi:hypothetical protein